MSKLEEVTTRLGKRYKKLKSAEGLKDKSRKEFFEAATEEVKSQTLAQKTVTVTAPDEGAARTLIAKQNPRWVIQGIVPLDVDGKVEATYEAVLEEDPQYKPFVFVNPADGQVYQRSVAQGSAILDDEALRADDPELWEEITVPTRELKPVEELTSTQLAMLEQYTYEGKPKVSLPAPREAKPEELEQDG